jgi:hypothetical protein
MILSHKALSVDDSLQYDGIDESKHAIKEQRKEKGILKKPRRPLQQRGFVSFCRCHGPSI